MSHSQSMSSSSCSSVHCRSEVLEIGRCCCCCCCGFCFLIPSTLTPSLSSETSTMPDLLSLHSVFPDVEQPIVSPLLAVLNWLISSCAAGDGLFTLDTSWFLLVWLLQESVPCAPSDCSCCRQPTVLSFVLVACFKLLKIPSMLPLNWDDAFSCVLDFSQISANPSHDQLKIDVLKCFTNLLRSYVSSNIRAYKTEDLPKLEERSLAGREQFSFDGGPLSLAMTCGIPFLSKYLVGSIFTRSLKLVHSDQKFVVSNKIAKIQQALFTSGLYHMS